MKAFLLAIFLVLCTLCSQAVASGSHGGIQDIEWSEVGWLIFNAAILVILAVILLRKKLAAFFQKRHESIITAIEEGTRAEREAQGELKRAEEQLQSLPQKLEQLEKDSQAYIEQEQHKRNELVEAEKKRAQREAQELIKLEQHQMELNIKKQMLLNAFQSVENILQHNASEKDHTRMVDKFIAQLDGPSGDILKAKQH